MELVVQERLVLDDLLSTAEGDLVLLRAVRSLRQKIGFSAEEVEKIELRSEGSQVQWNEEKAGAAEIEISEAESAIVVRIFEKVSAGGKLRQVHLDLYEKFVKS